jgi:hypothetical protein
MIILAGTKQSSNQLPCWTSVLTQAFMAMLLTHYERKNTMASKPKKATKVKKSVKSKAAVKPKASNKTKATQPKKKAAPKPASKPKTDEQYSKNVTKTLNVMAALNSPNGVTIDEITKMTGWLPHTARAHMSGIRKRLREKEEGTQIVKYTRDGKTMYKIENLENDKTE